MSRKKKMDMDIINTHAAGIDIGSRSHFVAVGQSLEDVKEFGVYAEDLTAICLWLNSYVYYNSSNGVNRRLLAKFIC